MLIPDDWEYVQQLSAIGKKKVPVLLGSPVLTQWHVGGKNYMAEDVIQKAIADHFGRQ